MSLACVSPLPSPPFIPDVLNYIQTHDSMSYIVSIPWSVVSMSAVQAPVHIVVLHEVFQTYPYALLVK